MCAVHGVCGAQVRLTSSLTLSVFGVLKEAMTVGVAVAAGDSFSPLNGLGLCLCLMGNAAYFLKKTQERVEEEEEARAVLSRSSSCSCSTRTRGAASADGLA